MNSVFDQAQLGHHLAGAATQVLETMFFASVEAESQISTSATQLQSGSRIGAALNFHGASKGQLSISLEREVARELATSFFGSYSEDGPEEDCRTVMAELTNMVCGAMLSHLDKHSIFCLDSPMPLPEGEEPIGEIVQLLRLESGLLRLAFSLDPDEQSARSMKLDSI